MCGPVSRCWGKQGTEWHLPFPWAGLGGVSEGMIWGQALKEVSEQRGERQAKCKWQVLRP